MCLQMGVHEYVCKHGARLCVKRACMCLGRDTRDRDRERACDRERVRERERERESEERRTDQSRRTAEDWI